MANLDEEKAKFKKALIGFATTFLIAVTSRMVILIFNSSTMNEAINYLFDNSSFWISTIAPSVAGGFLAQWKTAPEDCPREEEENK